MKFRNLVIALALVPSVAFGATNASEVVENTNYSFRGYCLGPYVGADTHLNTMRFKNGSNFSKRTLGGNVYGGLRLNDFMSAEVGGNLTKKGHSASTHHHKIKGVHLSAIFNSNILDIDSLSLLGGLGFSNSKATYQEVSTGLKASKLKLIPKVAGGVQYMLTDHVGVRGMVNWENTRKLQAQHINLGNIQPRNAISYSIGLNYLVF